MASPAAERVPVLVVDDDQSLTATIADILDLHGFMSRCAASGRDALLTAREMSPPPAVALVDLRLPDMDGFDLASKLHAQSDRLQVVILTGNATLDAAIRALRDEDCDFLVKPVEPALLVRSLRSAENRWRLRHTEEALERVQVLLHAVFNASPLPILVLTPDLRVQLWNAATERLFGWTAVDTVGRYSPIIPEDDRDKARALADAVLGGQSLNGVEMRRQRRDGSLVDVRAFAGGLQDSAGQPVGIAVVYEDVTERKRIEQHLEQAQRLDAIGRLAGGVAHDFNNLLGVIVAETELALREQEPGPRLDAALHSVRRSANRGAELTGQLLAFARRKPIAASVLDPNAVVTAMERMLRRVIGDRLSLMTALGGGIWPVEVDQGQLEQVITNLAINARDAMPGGGTLTITTRNVAAGEEGTPGAAGGGWVLIAVTDTGTGMTDEVRAKLFEPFFTTKAPGAGTGLGLATSYGIIQRFGGRIAVDSAPGHGSTFRVYLPRARRDLPVSVPSEAGPVPTGRETVVFVEDHAQLRELGEEILTNHGYTVHVAATGAEARRLIEELPASPDLIVSDINLPDCDGRDLVRYARSHLPRIRGLIVSGATDDATDEGGTGFLAKPYGVDALARAVREALA